MKYMVNPNKCYNPTSKDNIEIWRELKPMLEAHESESSLRKQCKGNTGYFAYLKRNGYIVGRRLG